MAWLVDSLYLLGSFQRGTSTTVSIYKLREPYGFLKFPSFTINISNGFGGRRRNNILRQFRYKLTFLSVRNLAMGHDREILIRVDKFEEENSTMINKTKPNAIP